MEVVNGEKIRQVVEMHNNCFSRPAEVRAYLASFDAVEIVREHLQRKSIPDRALGALLSMLVLKSALRDGNTAAAEEHIRDLLHAVKEDSQLHNRETVDIFVHHHATAIAFRQTVKPDTFVADALLEDMLLVACAICPGARQEAEKLLATLTRTRPNS